MLASSFSQTEQGLDGRSHLWRVLFFLCPVSFFGFRTVGPPVHLQSCVIGFEHGAMRCPSFVDVSASSASLSKFSPIGSRALGGSLNWLLMLPRAHWCWVPYVVTSIFDCHSSMGGALFAEIVLPVQSE